MIINGSKVIVEVISDEIAEIWSKKTIQERFAIMNRMWESARKMASHAVKAQHPDWTERQIPSEVAKRMSASDFDKSIFDRMLDENFVIKHVADDLDTADEVDREA